MFTSPLRESSPPACRMTPYGLPTSSFGSTRSCRGRSGVDVVSPGMRVRSLVGRLLICWDSRLAGRIWAMAPVLPVSPGEREAGEGTAGEEPFRPEEASARSLAVIAGAVSIFAVSSFPPQRECTRRRIKIPNKSSKIFDLFICAPYVVCH